ncbi:MAG TPA: maleylpyruvate isomerase family mycothiol-dependent enzyme [Chloroflexota bacterium]|jgi:uncharacterized protein (TIGR03083 family)
MATDAETIAHVREVGRAVQREAAAMARDWRGRDAAGWEAPTACREWTVKDVAAHVTDGAERAVVVARAALAGEPVPQYDTAERRRRHAALRALSGDELAVRLQRDLATVFQELDGVPAATLHGTTANLGGGPHTMAQFADQRLVETGLHAWDIRAGSDPDATLPPETAAAIIDFVLWRVPRLAGHSEARGVAPRYLCALEGAGGGPVTLAISPDAITATRTPDASADPALNLPVEAFIRLVWGRLDVPRALGSGVIRTRAPRDEMVALGALFPGH